MDKDLSKTKSGLQCPICGQVITSKWNLTLHLRVHNNDRRYKCDLCTKAYITNTELKKHKLLIHEKIKPQYKCKFCPNVYTSNHQKLYHEDLHDEIGHHECKYCSEVFKKFMAKSKHEKSCPKRTDTFFDCPKCYKKFASQAFVDRHVLKFHGITMDKPMNECQKCLKMYRKFHNCTFKPRVSKAKVEKIKCQNDEFKCTICFKQFDSNPNLLRHMSVKHPDEKKNLKSMKFKCTFCNKAFCKSYYLSNHIIEKHFTKSLTCHLCDFKCVDKKKLTLHMEKHQNLGKKCEKCGKVISKMSKTCNKCNSINLDKSNIKSDIIDIILEPINNLKNKFNKFYECFACGDLFYSQKEVYEHHATVHKTEFSKVISDPHFKCYNKEFLSLSCQDLDKNNFVNDNFSESSKDEISSFSEDSLDNSICVSNKTDIENSIEKISKFGNIRVINTDRLKCVTQKNKQCEISDRSFNPSTPSGQIKLDDQIVDMNGRKYLPLDELKKLDSSTILDFIRKIKSENMGD